MLSNKNITTTASHPLSSNSVEKRLENQAKSFQKKSKSRLQMIWLKNENGSLTARWTTQD